MGVQCNRVTRVEGGLAYAGGRVADTVFARSYEFFRGFVLRLHQEAGVQRFVVHARKALLGGLPSPAAGASSQAKAGPRFVTTRQNRLAELVPLRYDYVCATTPPPPLPVALSTPLRCCALFLPKERGRGALGTRCGRGVRDTGRREAAWPGHVCEDACPPRVCPPAVHQCAHLRTPCRAPRCTCVAMLHAVRAVETQPQWRVIPHSRDALQWRAKSWFIVLCLARRAWP